ncbi:MAG: GldG family protein, partial [Alphaproteobacteria bacterium]
MIQKLFQGDRGWIVGIIVALVLFVGLNASLTGVSGMRADLTEDRLFTVSDGTRKIVENIKEPITIELYFSQTLLKQVATYGNYADRVRDVIKEIAAISDDKITVVEFDPEPFSETEDEAVKAGLKGVPLDASGEKVYFGLAARIGDATGALPFFQPERESFLEYDLSKLLFTAANPEKPVVGVLSSLPLFGEFAPRSREKTQWPIIEMLEETFEVRSIIDATEELTDELDVLFLAHPANLTEDELYAVDQYLMKGGTALIMTDPHNEMARASLVAGRPMALTSNLNKLTKTWGVEVTEKKVLGDMKTARMVNAGKGGDTQAAPYLLWMSLREDNINDSDAVTRGVSAVNVASAGVITVADDAPVKFEPLLQTTEVSQVFDVNSIGITETNIMGFLDMFEPGGKKLTLGARISGAVLSAYPDGPPKKPEPPKPVDDKAADAAAGAVVKAADLKDGSLDSATMPDTAPGAAPDAKTKPETVQPVESTTGTADPEKAKPAHIAKSLKPLNVVLIADTDMLHQRFWLQIQDFFGQRVMSPFANNGDMVVNALDNLSGSSDLIGLRSRGTAQRPFTLVQSLRTEADQKYRKKEQDLVQRLAEAEKQITE